MLSGFFINITILISFIFLFHRLLYKTPLSTSSPLKQKIAAGTASGMLGLVLLAYTIPLNETTIIDLRLVPVTLMAVFGGWVPTIITGIIVAGGRLLMDFSLSSAPPLLLIALSVVSGGIIHTTVRKIWRRAVWMIFLTNLYMTVTLSMMLAWTGWLPAAGFYLLASLAGTGVSVYMFVHLDKVNQMFIRYQYQAYRDNLTALYNQRAFQELLGQAAEEYPAASRSLSLLVLDIDYFKQINDTYGHLEGDMVLKQLSHVLVASIRPNDMAFRIGGEEFGVILYDCDETHALTIAERVRADVARTPFIVAQRSTPLFITVSIGVGTYPVPGNSIEALYDMTDKALYQAKDQGRNCVCSSEASG
ncbi:diguanylate cyclase [Marinococcus luteus]|uniref:Diguanylate cyclase n=1 Tax=Marinococcus luteus TaxID=1122204 RepID=A0A1H2TF33_9BACI|nr:diguanylate cyclase [Marinococcus luteus]SDW42450.1 diguanylate cyclase [Marinococcus luteus]